MGNAFTRGPSRRNRPRESTDSLRPPEDLQSLSSCRLTRRVQPLECPSPQRLRQTEPETASAESARVAALSPNKGKPSRRSTTERASCDPEDRVSRTPQPVNERRSYWRVAGLPSAVLCEPESVSDFHLRAQPNGNQQNKLGIALEKETKKMKKKNTRQRYGSVDSSRFELLTRSST